jgi:hypothetical protein
MDLDGRKLILEIDLSNARPADEISKLIKQICVEIRSHVRKVHLRFFHARSSLSGL